MDTSRTETILVTDLVASTELLSRLGDDAAEGVRRVHFGLLREAGTRHDGIEVKNLGDGLVVAFASASSAAACAVAMQQAIARHNRARGAEPLHVRIGIAVGEVTVENGTRDGAPIVEAARVCGAADGGQILVTNLVRLLVGSRGSHEFTQHEPVDIGGRSPIAVDEVRWQADGTDTIPPPPVLRAASPLAFVGRTEERAALEAQWKESRAGERRVLLIGGEPGIGKTRLAIEFALEAHAEGAVVLFGRCDEDAGISYQPFAEALGHYVDSCSDVELEQRLAPWADELGPLLPRLAERLPGSRRTPDADPDTERYRLFQAISSLLSAISESAPVVLVLDDLHWADRATLLLLRYIVRAPEEMSMLLVGTYRDTELATDHPLTALLADLRVGRRAQRVALRGLSDAEIVDLLERSAGHELEDDGVAFAHVVRQETEGNPFFVREILLHLSESGAIAYEHGRWRAKGDIAELAIPESVRDVVGRRVHRLSETARRIVGLASVIGREFDLKVLARLAERSEDSVLDALDEATEAALIGEVEGSLGRFTFAHALVRHTLYSEMIGARRVRLHARVAEAIEEAYGTDSAAHVAELAHHWFEATPLTLASPSDLDKAIASSVRAAQRAAHALAHEQAADHYRRALQVLELTGDRQRQCEVQLALGESQRHAGDSGFRDTLLAAARAADELGDSDRLARAALCNSRGLWSLVGNADHERIEVLDRALAAVGDCDSSVRARLLTRLATELVFTDRAADRFALSDEALALAETTGDTSTLADVLIGRLVATWVPSTVTQRAADAVHLAHVAAALGDQEARGFAAFFSYIAALENGEIAGADAALSRLLSIAGERSHPMLAWLSTMCRGGRAMLAGELDEAEKLARQAFSVGQRTGQPDAVNLFAVQFFYVRHAQNRLEDLLDIIDVGPPHGAWYGSQAIAYATCGRLDAAADILRQLTVDGFADVPFDVAWVGAICCFAEAAVLLPVPVGLQELYDLLAPFEGQLMSYGIACTGSIAYYRGILAAGMGRRESAQAHFQTAIDVNRRLDAPVYLERAEQALAALE